MKPIFKAPDHYHPKAKESLTSIVRLLSKAGIERQDLPALSILADCYNVYFKALDLLNDQGIILTEAAEQESQQPTLPGMEPAFITKLKTQKVNPALKTVLDLQNQITKILIEFNLTPRSRKKTFVEIVPEAESPADKFIKNKEKETR